MALDTRHEPALISTWYGRPTAGLIDSYYRWSDASVAAALAHEQQVVHIVDARAAKMPRGSVRKRLLEHASLDLSAEVRIAMIAVLDDPALRGLIRLTVQLGGGRSADNLWVVESIDEGIELALQRLRDARIPAPVGLEPGRYRSPTA